MTYNYNSLILNRDQAAFKKLVDDASAKLTKYSREVSILGSKTGPGYEYSDYVLTIRVSHDRNSVTVYRNRDGRLVYAMINGNVASINYEYIYVEDHLQSLLKEGNG